ncbi:MAG: Na+/H+ antiporter subunit E [Pseudomonadales bacterium]|jgi:multicomponent Na+:H+ antiporter subunit E|nr:Na+/H+ antiporter subunit E [Pseudomonadales bacterium]|tara:strand:+ start:75 stop:551 length:477 start_codon:yes stop_codon:yes gene_type:complete
MRHKISLSIILIVFWLLNSGHYNYLILALGAASIAIVVLIAHRMDVVDHESQTIHLSLEYPRFGLWLIKEIVVANLTVVKHIWLGNKTITPTVKVIKASQTTDVGKVIYANSITLTPGTVTLGLVNDEIMVHALIQENIVALESGDMDSRVSRLEQSW